MNKQMIKWMKGDTDYLCLNRHSIWETIVSLCMYFSFLILGNSLRTTIQEQISKQELEANLDESFDGQAWDQYGNDSCHWLAIFAMEKCMAEKKGRG